MYISSMLIWKTLKFKDVLLPALRYNTSSIYEIQKEETIAMRLTSSML